MYIPLAYDSVSLVYSRATYRSTRIFCLRSTVLRTLSDLYEALRLLSVTFLKGMIEPPSKNRGMSEIE